MVQLKPVVEEALRLRVETGSGTLGKRKFEVSTNIDNKALFVFFDDAQVHVIYSIPWREMIEEANKLIPFGARAKWSRKR